MTDDTRKLIERLRTDAHHPGVAPATALQAADALEASLPTEQTAEERLLHAIFEGESDRDALARIAKRVIDVEVKYDDDDWHRFADAALAEGFRRSPVPPETDETYIAWAAQEANRGQARVFVTGLEGDFPSGWRDGFEAGLLHRALAAVPPVTEEAWSQPVLEHLAPSLSWWAGRVTDGPLSVEESAVLSGLLLDARNATATEAEEPAPGTLEYAQKRAEQDGSLDDGEDGYDGPCAPVSETEGGEQ